MLANDRILKESSSPCLLYTSDAADEEDSVDLGGRRIIKKKLCDNNEHHKLAYNMGGKFEVLAGKHC